MGFSARCCHGVPMKPSPNGNVNKEKDFAAFPWHICYLYIYIVGKITFISEAAQVFRHRKGNACTVNPTM
jgi:hypothetical protein